jgi:outer membrane protein TolC
MSTTLVADISLQSAIQMAIENNYALQMAKEDVHIAMHNYNDIRGQLFPQFNLVGSYRVTTNSLPPSAIPPSFSLYDGLDDNPTSNEQLIAGTFDHLMSSMVPDKRQEDASVVGQINMQQLLFSGGKLINGIKVLDRIKTLQSKRYELQLQNTIITVIDAYYDLYLAQQVLNIQLEALENANRHFARVENLFSQGLVSEYDKLRAELEVARLSPEVLNFENMKNLAEENFNRLTGNYGEVSLSPELIEKSEAFADFQVSLADAIEKAHQDRIELYLTNLMADIYQVQLNAERGNFLPNVVLTADITRYNVSNSLSIKSNDFGTRGSIGIALQMPLFTGMSNSSKTLRSKHELRRAQHDHINASELITLEVRQSWQSFHQSLRFLETQEKNLSLSQRALSIAQARFENQSGIQLEVFDAQIQHKAAQMSLSQAKIKIIKDYFALNKAIGNKLSTLIGEL